MTLIPRSPDPPLLNKLLSEVKIASRKRIITKKKTIWFRNVWNWQGIRGFYNSLSILLIGILTIVKEEWRRQLITTFILAVCAGLGGCNIRHIITDLYISWLWNKTLHQCARPEESNPYFIKANSQGKINTKGKNMSIGSLEQAKLFNSCLHFPLFSSFLFNFTGAFHPLWIRGVINFPFTHISLSCKEDMLQFLLIFPDWKQRENRLILINPKSHSRFIDIELPFKISDFPSNEVR